MLSQTATCKPSTSKSLVILWTLGAVYFVHLQRGTKKAQETRIIFKTEEKGLMKMTMKTIAANSEYMPIKKEDSHCLLDTFPLRLLWDL